MRDFNRNICDMDEVDQSIALPGNREDLLHKLARTARRDPHLAKHLSRTIVEPRRALEHFGVEQNRPKLLAEILRDSQCESSNRIHFLLMRDSLRQSLTRNRCAKCARQRTQC